MRHSLLLLLLLFTACGVHNNIRFVKNEPIIERHIDRNDIEKFVETSVDNASENQSTELNSQVEDLASAESTITLVEENYSKKESKPIVKARKLDPDPNKEIIEEAVENERKAKISMGWSITSLIFDIIFPYIGIPLTIVAAVYYIIVDRNRYFTVRGDKMMRTSMILLIVQGGLLILLATAIILLLLFF